MARATMRYTKRMQTILAVLALAHKQGLSLPVGVDLYRSELRAAIRRWRKLAREKLAEGRGRLAESASRRADGLVRESARARRLQLEFASWRTGTSVVRDGEVRKRIGSAWLTQDGGQDG